MDKALKAKWLEALRSGKYKQGRKKLRSEDDEFCCLGVLCDISGQGQWKLEPSSYCYYKEEERDFYGLPSFMVNIDGARGVWGELVTMNDIDKLSFPEIAEWIEKNIKGE